MPIFMQLFILILSFSFFGCATSGPIKADLGSQIDVCVGADQDKRCNPLATDFKKKDMLRLLYKLFKANEDKKILIYESDPETKVTKSLGASAAVIGPIPGIATQSETKFKDIIFDEKSSTLKLQATMPGTWNGIPYGCTDSEVIISIPSPKTIEFQFKDTYCNMLGIGNGYVKKNIQLDYINVTNGQIGGYWAMSAVMLPAFSNGSGYVIMQLPYTDNSMIADYKGYLEGEGNIYKREVKDLGFSCARGEASKAFSGKEIELGIGSILNKMDNTEESFYLAWFLNQCPITIGDSKTKVRLVKYPSESTYSITGRIDGNIEYVYLNTEIPHSYKWDQVGRFHFFKNGRVVDEFELKSKGNVENETPIKSIRVRTMEDFWIQLFEKIGKRLQQDS
jgi:hypothetical protein